MTELIVRIVINALALFVAVKVLLVALVFALVNSYIKPIVKALSMPIGLLTLGLVAFVINAAMLLLTAWVSGQLKLGFKLGTFPPDLNSDAIIGALVAAVIISVISTLASVALSPRKMF